MTNELIKSVAKKLDDLVDFKKHVKGLPGMALEMFDGKVFEAALIFLKTKGYDRLTSAQQNDVDTFLMAFVTGDWSNVDQHLAARVNSIIDLPGIDEDEEAEFFAFVSKWVFKFIYRRTSGVQTKYGGETPPEEPPKPGDK